MTGRARVSRSRTAQPEFPDIAEEQLRRLAWEKCGIVRNGEGLARRLRRLQAVPMQAAYPNRAVFELRGMREVLFLIASCALAREESRGAHYRTDFPEKRPEFQKHSRITKNSEVTLF